MWLYVCDMIVALCIRLLLVTMLIVLKHKACCKHFLIPLDIVLKVKLKFYHMVWIIQMNQMNLMRVCFHVYLRYVSNILNWMLMWDWNTCRGSLHSCLVPTLHDTWILARDEQGLSVGCLMSVEKCSFLHVPSFVLHLLWSIFSDIISQLCICLHRRLKRAKKRRNGEDSGFYAALRTGSGPAEAAPEPSGPAEASPDLNSRKQFLLSETPEQAPDQRRWSGAHGWSGSKLRN